MKDIKGVRPEVVDLSTLAFCNQIDILAGPLCIQHDFTVSQLVEFKGKWDADKIDEAIIQSNESRKIQMANDRTAKMPGKNIEVFELRGNLPAKWRNPEAEAHEYEDAAYYVCYYDDAEGVKHGITLFEGKDKPLRDNFKALKIDTVRSKGRACGKSVVERLFEPQVWNNYAGIKIKDLLDSAINVFQTDSEKFGNQKLSDLKNNTILKHEPGRPITKVDGSLQNIGALAEHQAKTENSARELGSASDASLGRNPTSGTPFSLEALVVQEGQGIHDYRQGKIATFFADILYPDLILPYLVKEMNGGKTFSDELSLDELTEISEIVAQNEAEREIMEMILDGKVPPPEVRDQLIELKKTEFMKKGSRRFMEIMKDELDDLPVEVMINIKGKQKRMAENADKITNIIREIIANPQAFSQIPGIGKAFNELLEDSGMSPIDFSQITATGAFEDAEQEQPAQPQPPQLPAPEEQQLTQ
ncbi:hypothetical protein KAT92_05950 [Candidatus Babeliales bacterium]|nr:hypothetical protein [Candidatus Babeliales bacterium]